MTLFRYDQLRPHSLFGINFNIISLHKFSTNCMNSSFCFSLFCKFKNKTYEYKLNKLPIVMNTEIVVTISVVINNLANQIVACL